MNDALAQLLKNLQLGKMAELLDPAIAEANEQHLSYDEFLAGLLRAQYHHKQDSALASRIRKACLPQCWTLEAFPFKKQPGVDQRQIRTFGQLDFLPKAENIVFIGPTGVGKTGLATGIMLKALQNGYRCQFIRAQTLFDDMYSSLADHSSSKLIKHLAGIHLLLIDELGYLNLKPEQTNIFFRLMEERYQRHSTIISTNLEYSEWPSLFGNPPLVDALLDRVRHQCHTVRITGPSLRASQG
jgi:DNA replication protein DnaC